MASDEPAAVIEPIVTGAIVLPEGAEVPADANWSVELQDATRMDVAAETLAVDEGDAMDVVDGTIPFQIEYDPELIDDRFTYTLNARVEGPDGTLLYINDTVTPGVIEGEPQQDVEVVTIDVQAQAAEAEAMMEEAGTEMAEESPEA